MKTILILAGGKSTRMNGCDKANLPYHHHTFLEEIAGEFESLDAKYISNNKTITHSYPGYTCIEDEYDAIGPMSGLVSFFHQTCHDHVFVVACDMPYLSLDICHKLYDIYNQEDCLYVYDDDHDYPLCAIYSRSILPILTQQIEKHHYGLMRAIKQSKSRRVHIDTLHIDSKKLSNINTPEDLERM